MLVLLKFLSGSGGGGLGAGGSSGTKTAALLRGGGGGVGTGGGAGSSSALVLMTGMSSALERMIRNPRSPIAGVSAAHFGAEIQAAGWGRGKSGSPVTRSCLQAAPPETARAVAAAVRNSPVVGGCGSGGLLVPRYPQSDLTPGIARSRKAAGVTRYEAKPAGTAGRSPSQAGSGLTDGRGASRSRAGASAAARGAPVSIRALRSPE